MSIGEGVFVQLESSEPYRPRSLNYFEHPALYDPYHRYIKDTE